MFFECFSALWHIAVLLNADNDERRGVGDTIVAEAVLKLTQNGKVKNRDAAMLQDSRHLFKELIMHAGVSSL